ncbi:MAG: nucleotidyl transferase AbiEii/AbiGii toxin family protein [Paracoccaceae bacterium]|nr:nucleotidyl transferase AbiEii/AbiGii toxin family protein [Paracoccaceae bacterium]
METAMRPNPPAECLDYPVLLDMPAPRLRGYARETVVAEKFQAMVDQGIANSRMKDYFDLNSVAWLSTNGKRCRRGKTRKSVSSNNLETKQICQSNAVRFGDALNSDVRIALFARVQPVETKKSGCCQPGGRIWKVPTNSNSVTV